MSLWTCPYKDDCLNVVSGRLGHLGHLGAPFWVPVLGLLLSLEKDLGYVVCGTGPLCKDSEGPLGGRWQRNEAIGTLCGAWSLPWSPLTTAWLGAVALWFFVVSAGLYFVIFAIILNTLEVVELYAALHGRRFISWLSALRWPLRLRLCLAEKAHGVFNCSDWLNGIICFPLIRQIWTWLSGIDMHNSLLL